MQTDGRNASMLFGLPHWLLFGLGVFLGVVGCIELSVRDCQLSCSVTGACPQGLTCSNGICRTPGEVGRCSITGAPGASLGDAAPDPLDASNTDAPHDPSRPPPGAADTSFEDAASDGAVEPAPDASSKDASASDAGEASPVPPNEVCIGSACISLSPVAQAGLRLWLDSTTLPPAGRSLVTWPDRSANKLDGVPGKEFSGAEFDLVVVDSGPLGRRVRLNRSWLRLPEQALKFDGTDFVVTLVMQVGAPGQGAPDAGQSAIDLCLLSYAPPEGQGMSLLSPMEQPQRIVVKLSKNRVFDTILSAPRDVHETCTHVYTLQRTGSVLALRADGREIARSALPRDFELGGLRSPLLGSCTLHGSQILSDVSAVVGFKGALPTAEVSEIESFLQTSLLTPAERCAP